MKRIYLAIGLFACAVIGAALLFVDRTLSVPLTSTGVPLGTVINASSVNAKADADKCSQLTEELKNLEAFPSEVRVVDTEISGELLVCARFPSMSGTEFTKLEISSTQRILALSELAEVFPQDNGPCFTYEGNSEVLAFIKTDTSYFKVHVPLDVCGEPTTLPVLVG